MRARLALPPLYPIVDVAEASSASCGRAIALARELAAAGIDLIQLRAKGLGAGAMSDLAGTLVETLREQGARLIVNDRADVARIASAAGVHLGDEDLPVAAARSVFGDAAIIGYSTHTIEEVAAAATSSADYLGFGPVFDSPTKPHVRAARGVEMLARACRAAAQPVVAIGGVTLATAPELWRAGAASVAVIGELERASDARALARDYLRAAGR